MRIMRSFFAWLRGYYFRTANFAFLLMRDLHKRVCGLCLSAFSFFHLQTLSFLVLLISLRAPASPLIPLVCDAERRDQRATRDGVAAPDSQCGRGTLPFLLSAPDAHQDASSSTLRVLCRASCRTAHREGGRHSSLARAQGRAERWRSFSLVLSHTHTAARSFRALTRIAPAHTSACTRGAH